MQRVTPRGRGVRTFLALVAAVTTAALTTASIAGAAPSAPDSPAHFCPPVC
jgi:hypothetical protein